MEAKDFVRKLLRLSPEQRVSSAAALQHPWIQSASKGHSDEVCKEKQQDIFKSIYASSKRTKFQHAASSFIAHHMVDEKDREEIDAIFRLLDRDGNGKLDRDEVKQGFKEAFN